MIDIIYPLGKGSTWDNNELRYSLRSVEKHLSNYRNVYIVGECPDWIQNVIHIPHDDLYYPDRNIMLKVKAAMERKEISKNAFFLNDDHFLLTSADALNYPFYHKGNLRQVTINPNNYYHTYITGTIHELEKRKLPTYHFDTHTPIVFNKQQFLEVMAQYNWEELRLVMKSVYCNTLGITGTYKEDCKISSKIAYWKLKERIKNADVFSIADKCFVPYSGEKESSVKKLLEELYPNKSKYEI
jgi:hypothetical protein